MLSVMRKHAQNWLMKAILFIIIIVFVFYFGSIRGRQQTETVAIVNDTHIPYHEYSREYQNLLDSYHEQFGAALNDELMKTLNPKQRALDNLIDRAVIRSQAAELKLAVTADELKHTIYSYPAFQKNGVFDKALYEQRLRFQKMTPEDFEAMQNEMLLAAKLEALIKESVKVSDAEAYDVYRIQNGTFNIEFVRVPCASLVRSVTATDSALEEYLKNHGEEFRTPRRADLKYIVFPAADFASAEVTDEEMENYWRDYESSFKKADGSVPAYEEVKEEVRRHVRLMKGMEAAHKAAATAHDTIYMEENFEGYAARNGRTIHTATIHETRPAEGPLAALYELESVTFQSSQGDILPILSDQTGHYVFKVTAIKPSQIPPLREIRNAVLARYAEDESKNICRRKAEQMLARMKQGDAMGVIAGTEGFTVSETGMFAPGPEVPGIGASPEIVEALFELSETHRYSDSVFLIDGSYIIIRLKETGRLDNADWELKKDRLKRHIAEMKQETFFRSWLEGTRNAMMEAGTIKIMKNTSEL